MLITSVEPFEYTLDESSSKPKIKGVFQRAETQNQNKRIYPKRILEREVNALMGPIKERTVMGELEHPQETNVNLERASHLITDLKFDGNTVIGEAEILVGTVFGNILEALLKNNVKVGISSRGKGSLINRGSIYEVGEDYQMITFDIVSKPSTPGAYPALVSEGLNGEGNEINMSSLIDKILNEELTTEEVSEIINWERGKKKIFY